MDLPKKKTIVIDGYKYTKKTPQVTLLQDDGVYRIEGFERKSGEVASRVNFKSILHLVAILILVICVIRVFNSVNSLSFNDFLDYLEHFNRFSSVVKQIQLPTLSSVDVPSWLSWVVGPINTFVNLINIFWSIGTMLWRVLLVLLDFFSFVLFGITLPI